MTNHTFTDLQAAHALEVVLKLMKERRFFLYHHDPRSVGGDPGHTLAPQVFGPVIELDRKISVTYAAARRRAEKSILEAEHELGITRPDLSGNKQIVQCKRYTGGLDILRVYPLTAFAEHVPRSLEKLVKECLQQLLQGKTEDDLAPKEMRKYRDYAQDIGEKIWEQFQSMDVRNPETSRCVVMMETRFNCAESDENRDFMQGKTRDMQEFPHALGYLFYRYSLYSRIVLHNHVVFSTSRKSHVNVQHWKGEEEPFIRYDASDGYDCSVIFVTVL